MPDVGEPRPLRFDGFLLDRQRATLCRLDANGEMTPVHIGSRGLCILSLLLERDDVSPNRRGYPNRLKFGFKMLAGRRPALMARPYIIQTTFASEWSERSSV